MATCSNILAWEIPWTEEPVRLQSVGSQRDTTEHETSTQVLYSTGSYIQYPVINYIYVHGKNTKKRIYTCV